MVAGKRRRHAEKYDLNVYVAGPTRKSLDAVLNLRRICDDCLPGQCRIHVVDLLANPRAARDDQIVAVPTVIRKKPPFSGRVIGDMSDSGRVLKGLGLV
jgi:circadian clock protein KaiB